MELCFANVARDKAEPLVSEASACEVEMAIAKLTVVTMQSAIANQPPYQKVK